MLGIIRQTHCALTMSAIALAIGVLSDLARAQIIAVKTQPIADGEQFSFFPSANLGMGGVSIAIRDSIHDLFVNPAKGGAGATSGRIRRSYFFGAPSFFSVSSRAGSGSTFPAGVVARSGSSFAAAAVAIQTVTDGQRGFVPSGISVLAEQSGASGVGGADDSHTNRYGFAMLGHTFAASKLSIGASALWSALGAVDGVNLLYTQSRSVSQSGGTADLRLGLLKEWNGGHSFEAMLLQRRANMSNDVTYVDLFWDPIRRQTIERPRLELDGERTRTSGLHLGYQRALADSAWRIGAIITANRVNHLSTPQYEIASVPSDRGRSSALNLGLGVARTQGGATLAIDAIYEPIWSRLAVVADSETTTSTSIKPGGTAVDNRLRFSNALLRVGLSQDVDLDSKTTALRLQLGMQARSVYYSVDQRDLVGGSTRKGGDDWLEWTRSWGIVLRRPAFEIRYAGRLTSGTGRPGVAGPDPIPLQPSSSSFAPPPPPLATTINKVRVTMHQLSISLPMR
jgi:hypothetical protein